MHSRLSELISGTKCCTRCVSTKAFMKVTPFDPTKKKKKKVVTQDPIDSLNRATSGKSDSLLGMLF
uniref:Uncharacterized protein n=1 Tax=Brassica campestris TaxID=3711 RepID=M4DND7_BRACM